MSLILWELPLSSPPSGFEEIICEGVSLLALSHHPPKDTAGLCICHWALGVIDGGQTDSVGAAIEQPVQWI